MSLQFVMGPSGSGKSHYLYEWVTKEASEHPKQNYIVLVPEQFTMQTQKDLVMASPKKGILNIEVLSFHRLAQRVLEETGENTRLILNDTGKNFVIRKIAEEYEENLKVLGKQLKKMGCVSEVKSIISEFTQYEVGTDTLDELIAQLEDRPQLKYKLTDIRLIYEKFQEFLREKYITGEEVLDVLTSVAHKSRLLQGSVIVMDGFTGFTPIQNKLIEELFRICKEIMISVTMDKRENPYVYKNQFQLFGLSKQMVTSLIQIAEKQSVEIKDTIYLYDTPVYRFRGNAALGFLESHLFRYSEEKYEEEQDCVQIWRAQNPRAEIDFVAQQIRRLVRKEGYRYRDIAVLTNEMTAYVNCVDQVFDQYEIPYFMDHKRSILLNACVEYIRSVLAMIEQDFKYESVFRYLRTGLVDIPREEIDQLETYVLAMGIHGYKKWQEKWIRRTVYMDENDLESINRIRESFIHNLESLTQVLKQKKKTVKDVTTALIEFFMAEGLQKRVQDYQIQFGNEGELALEKEYAQVYRIIIELLNQFVELLGNETLSLKEYCELLDAGLEQAKVGIIPPSVDQVVVGDVERSRIKDVKAVFLVGANEKYIPGDINGGGLLSEFDRQVITKKDVKLAPDAKEKTYIQKFYLYSMLTKPTEHVFLTFSKSEAGGKSMRPSYLVTELMALYEKLTVREADVSIGEREFSVRKGIDALVEGLQSEQRGLSSEWQELYTWYKKHPQWHEKIKQLVAATFYENGNRSLSRECAKALYGDVLENSISRLEKYSACAYAHFLEYGLRLKERETYEFNSLDMGILFHGAIERFSQKLVKTGYTWTNLPEDKRDELIEESIDESIVDYGNSILYSSARNEYIILRLKRMLRRTVWALQKQIAESEGFVPAGYEVTFRNHKVDLPGVGQMRLSGKIDRVDIQEKDDDICVKIVDYKTGKKKFDISDLYHGLQMQLVVYMSAAVRMQQQEHPEKNVSAAGFYYYQMQDPLIEKKEIKTTIDEAILAKLKMDGVDIGDEGTISAEIFRTVSAYAEAKVRKIGTEILNGKAEVSPYKIGTETGCTFCPYHAICGFDERITGYEYRELKKLKPDEAIAQMAEEVRSWE